MAGDDQPRPTEKSPIVEHVSTLLKTGVGVHSVALTVLMVLGVLYTLHFGRPVILPVVLAFILSMLLIPVVRFFRQAVHLPNPIGAGVVVLILIGGIPLAVTLVAEPAVAWMQTVPSKMPEIKYRLKSLTSPLEKVREATAQVEDLTAVESEETEVVQVRETSPMKFVMSQTPILAANLVVMVVLLYFMLASGDIFLRKLVRVIPTFEDKRRAVEMAREIELRISKYLRTVTIINICLGIAVGVSAHLVGLTNAYLWGVLAFVLNYIPYLGAFIGIVASFLVSLLTFESTAYAFVMPGIYLLLNILEGNFITPSIVGRILTLNPVVVFLSLMFWGWLWGIAGALLAVPILAIFKIVCDHFKPLAPIGEFVGGEAAEE